MEGFFIFKALLAKKFYFEKPFAWFIIKVVLNFFEGVNYDRIQNRKRFFRRA